MIKVLVWLISDCDRLWHAEIPHAMPIGYAMKATAFHPIGTMCTMCDEVVEVW